MRRLLCALLGVGLLLGGCAAGEPAAVPEPESSVAAAGKSITEQEAVERVRELLIQNSQKLCTTEENIAMLQNSLFTCDGTVTVEEAGVLVGEKRHRTLCSFQGRGASLRVAGGHRELCPDPVTIRKKGRGTSWFPLPFFDMVS